MNESESIKSSVTHHFHRDAKDHTTTTIQPVKVLCQPHHYHYHTTIRFTMALRFRPLGGSLVRWFSSSGGTTNIEKIHIHFGTSTGTAQLFAQELQNALQESSRVVNTVKEVDVHPMSKTKSLQALDPNALHLFVVSTAGVGEPPAMAQDFFRSLEKQETASHAAQLQFGVFGLGNSAAHPHHYNFAGKNLHELLVSQQARPFLPLTLGDDSDCIEEDFDQWQTAILKKLTQKDQSNDTNKKVPESSTPTQTTSNDKKESLTVAFGKRLQLVPTEPNPDETTRTDLWDIMPSYYHPETQRWQVQRHSMLNPQPTANGLHELQLALAPDPTRADSAISYDAGDHLVVYPCQPDYLVDAYLDHWGIPIATALHSKVEVAPSTAFASNSDDSTFPHPTGISLYDTLRHCVDLMAPPSPRLARTLLGRDDIDYKEQVFSPRHSPLALLKQSKNSSVSLEELICHLPAVAPRYYSIASSSLLHPNSLLLAYRPIRFLNSYGNPVYGMCTSYFASLRHGSTLMAYVNKNPTFRLPTDPHIPIILMAGGCGVAAVRALMEEIQARGQDTPVYIFLGFRSPSDAAYVDLMERINPRLLDVAWSVSCTDSCTQSALVSDRVRVHGDVLYDLLEKRGAYLYACGGARTFGAAIQRELHGVYEAHGYQEPAKAIQILVEQGRYCEDLAD